MKDGHTHAQRKKKDRERVRERERERERKGERLEKNNFYLFIYPKLKFKIAER